MPARIKISIGSTVNLGDFNNVKFDFGIEDDVPDGSTRSEHFEKCFNWVWNRLDSEVSKAKRAARG